MKQPTTVPRHRSVLLVEDEQDIAQLVKLHLGEHCDEVAWSASGTDGIQLAMARHWDLIILDLRLPGINGLDICRRLRSDQPYVPILMLTAKSSELDKVLGLELGADDYLTKPFSVLELVARVKALLRRYEAMSGPVTNSAPEPILRVGSIELDSSQHQASVAGKSVDLTAREFELLLYFLRHPGQVFSRVQLLDAVWGYGHDGYEHTVNSHINRLRAKIEPDPTRPKYISTVWGVGYRLNKPTIEELAC